MNYSEIIKLADRIVELEIACQNETDKNKINEYMNEICQHSQEINSIDQFLLLDDLIQEKLKKILGNK